MISKPPCAAPAWAWTPACAPSRCFDAAAQAPAQPAPIDLSRPVPAAPEQAASARTQPLLDMIRRDFPACAQPMLTAGVRRQLEFQDLAYAREYLERMKALRDLDARHGGEARQWELTCAAARYLATAMAYDDVIRVADLKTRATRFERVRQEVGARPDQLVYTTEFMHPRLEEISAPARRAGPLAGKLRPSAASSSAAWARAAACAAARWAASLMLYALAGMRRCRATLRHQIEKAGLEQWLDLVARLAPQDYALAVETVNAVAW